MERRKLSKGTLIAEQVVYTVMLLYLAMFLLAIARSLLDYNQVIGIISIVVLSIFFVLCIMYTILRWRLLLTKEDIYDDDLKIRKVFGFYRNDELLEQEVERFVPEDEDNLDEEAIINKILKNDENFSKSMFISDVYYIYKCYEDSICKLDETLVRPFMTDDCYMKHKVLINKYSNRKYMEKRTNVTVRTVAFDSYKTSSGKESLTLSITARMKKYCVNEDGKVVDGDKDEYMDVPYILTFIRKKGVKYDQSTPVDNCPHCGKKLKVNEDGYCLECDVDIDTGEYGFVLSDIKSIE